MTKLLNVYGPPGTGKTTFLTTHIINQMKLHGTNRVGAVTYTRAAAAEIVARAGAALKVRNPRFAMPFVGTIHSLCYKALGQPPLVDGKAYAQFCETHGVQPPEYGKQPDETPYWWADEDTEEIGEGAMLRRVCAEAAHRGVPARDAANRFPNADPERLQYLYTAYRTWKRTEHLLDFEDILEQGREVSPPIDVLFLDEAQDNSPLLWSVIDRWAEEVSMLVCAGDPYQAIYIFGGADPALFRGRPGKWTTLGVSHRLTPQTAAYSKRILRGGGWEDPFFDEWNGAYAGDPGGSTLYLARTHRLLNPVREELVESGTPFIDFTKTSPLRTVAAEAYLTLTRIARGQAVPWPEFLAAATNARHNMAKGEKPYHAPPKKGYGTASVGDAIQFLGNIEKAKAALPYSSYFRKIESIHGLKGLVLRPTTSVGTIHSAKGREADHTVLVSSWGWMPSRALSDELGRKRESLVAYVAATRHRGTLRFWESRQGKRYPWP